MVGLAAGTFLLNFLLFRKVSEKSEDLIKADLMKEEIKRDRKDAKSKRISLVGSPHHNSLNRVKKE